MTVALIVLVAAVLLVLLAAAADRARTVTADRRAAGIRPKVLVNLVDDTAVEGVLWRTTSRWLIVAGGTLHQYGKATPLDGQTLIGRDRILFVQKVG